MEPNWSFAISRRSLAVPGQLFISYLERGGSIMMTDERVPPSYQVIDPKTAKITAAGNWSQDSARVDSMSDEPRVIIFSASYG
jgi:hypothetical protein